MNFGGQSAPGGYGSHYNTGNAPYFPGDDEENYDNEPPLLEELGVNFDHIWSKTKAVMYPADVMIKRGNHEPIEQRNSEDLLKDTDLAGPLFFCLLLGGFLLFSGKVSDSNDRSPAQITFLSPTGSLRLHIWLQCIWMPRSNADHQPAALHRPGLLDHLFRTWLLPDPGHRPCGPLNPH